MNSQNLTEDEIRQIVQDELDNKTDYVAESIPFTRREILKGATMLGTSAAVGGLGVYGAVGRASAQSNPGQGTLGTTENPLEEIYVDTLHQNEDVIDTDTINPLSGSSIAIGGTTDYQENTISNVGSASIDEAVIPSQLGIPVYSDDSNAPNETHYFNDNDSTLKYKDGAGTIHDDSDVSTHDNAAHSAAFISAGDGTERQIWIIANGASDPSGADPEDIILEEES